jgi:hypothetical protein
LNKKTIAILIIAVLAVSTLAMLTPKAAATGEWQIGNISIDDSTFLRCYDYNYEQNNNGYTSNEKYDTAWMSVSLPAYTLGYDAQIQVHLLKQVTVDGNIVRNGIFIDGAAIGYTNGVTWVDTYYFDYYDWMGGECNPYYNLNWNSIFFGYDQFPNYWSPTTFEDDGLRWAGHDIKVYFAAEFYAQNWYGGWDKIGATCDIPDAVFDFHTMGGCTTDHSEEGWESWKWMIPDSNIHFACSTQWTNVYGSASISNPYEAQYRTPDSNYATFLSASSGATARACYWIGGPCSGTVYIYGDSMNSPFSRFLVYVSSDNYNWRLSSEQLVYNNGDRWIDCGTPSGTYQYVLVIAYDSGTTSYMKVNCINCGGHY